MARPYGLAYGNAIWQSHMAKPYGSRGRGCRRGRGLCFEKARKTFSGILALKNDMFKLRNCMFLIKQKKQTCFAYMDVETFRIELNRKSFQQVFDLIPLWHCSIYYNFSFFLH